MISVKQNLHTHTTFCDGKNTPAEMAQAAVCCGLSSLGFSGHAYTPHDESYCMSIDGTIKYREELLRLREHMAGQLGIFIGLEQDYFSSEPVIEKDYLIGSVHYVRKDGEYIPVDETAQHIVNAVSSLYGGDVYSFLEDYYELVSDIHNKTGCEIVGHIDLVEKFNKDGSLFDRTHPRYVEAYERAVSELASRNCIFEINTGAMSRGYTDYPYPQRSVLMCIKKYGGRIAISSDSHSIDTVNYKLDEMCRFAAECGFDERYELDGEGVFAAKALTEK